MRDRTSPIHRLYIITNSANGKNYVGQSSSHFLSTRWGKHVACAKHGVDTYLYRAMRKHGLESFSIEEIARCHNKKDLLTLEKFWIGLLKSNKKEFGYNQTVGGEAPKHSEETKKKISEIQKGRTLSEERRKRQREILFSPEVTAKRIAAVKVYWAEAKRTKTYPAALGTKKNIMTPEGRKAISEANKRRWQKWRSLQ